MISSSTVQVAMSGRMADVRVTLMTPSVSYAFSMFPFSSDEWQITPKNPVYLDTNTCFHNNSICSWPPIYQPMYSLLAVE